MANEENLKPFNQLTEEEQRELARKGGRASVESRRRRKTLREELLALLEEGDIQNQITLSLLEKAKKGDTKAYEVVRDTIGEKPTDKQEVELKTTNINITLEEDSEDE